MSVSNAEIREFLAKNPQFLAKHTEVAKLFKTTPDRIRGIARRSNFTQDTEHLPQKLKVDTSVEQPKAKKTYPQPYLEGNPSNVLVIGDLHAPFMLEGYLEFCQAMQKQFNCGTVVQIGDLTDGHSFSYHESDPDGMSVGTEVDVAREQLDKLFYMFPKAYCTLGNHDMLPYRKAKTSGLSKTFMRSINDIWGAPDTWKFVNEVEIDGVLYTHGTGSSGPSAAFQRAKDSRTNLVMGHTHSFTSVQYSASHRDLLWAMQVGCGIDNTAYAFEYGSNFAKKPIISCGVVLDKGKIPIVLAMPLGTNYPKQ